MKFSQLHLDELNLLVQFDISSAATGIKVHSAPLLFVKLDSQ